MTDIDRKILVLPDLHAPYHDARALDLIEKVVRKERPSHLVIIGDWADCHAVSAHQKTPERRLYWQEEIETAAAALCRVRPWGDELAVCEGNHETRLSRYLMEHAPELSSTHASIRELLGVTAKEWHPYRTHFSIAGMSFTHDLGHSGPNSLKQTMDAFGACITFGHTHRLGVHYDGNVDGSHRVAMNVGWLGDESHVNYMHAAKIRSWQKGFGLIVQRGKLSWCSAIPIIKGACVVNGRYYKV